MASLFDPEILSLLAMGSQPASLMGAAREQARPFGGLLGAGSSDPLSAGNYALAAGLMRGDFAGGVQGYSNAMIQGEDRDYKRQAQQLAMGKGVLELKQMVQAQERQKALREALARAESDPYGDPQGGRPGLPQGMPQSGEYGAPLQGGSSALPMTGQRMPQGMPQGPQGGQPGTPPQGYGSAPGNSTNSMIERMLRQARVYQQAGDTKSANDILDAANKWRTEFSPTPQIMRDPKTGELVNVIIAKDGSSQVVPFGVKPDIQLENLGGRTLVIDKNRTTAGTSFDRTMTPGEVASNKVAQGNLAVSRERLALDRDAPQYMQTDSGIVALPKRPGGGPIVGQEVTGPDGQPLRKSPPLKPIPQGAADAILTNRRALEQIDRAIALVEGKDVGGAKGDKAATGVKGYFPSSVLNRLDPLGIDARAEISDIGSLKIHERSGAASTLQEMKRIDPFIPSATDNQETNLKKLRRLRTEVQAEADGLEGMYVPEQGYRAPPAKASGQISALPLPEGRPTASNLTKGQVYELPNGARGRWDGFVFKAIK